MTNYQYSRWDGTQEIFATDQDDLISELSDQLMDHGDVRKALQDLFRNGLQGRDQRFEGLKTLIEKLKDMRKQQLARYNLDSIMDDLKQQLEDVVRTEREGIQKRLEEAREQASSTPNEDPEQMIRLLEMMEQRAQHNQQFLDNLPESMGGAIQELNDYEFNTPEAQRKFQELVNLLKQRMMENHMQALGQQLKSITSEQIQSLRQTIQDLNQMLQEHMLGNQPDFQSFIDKHGHMFGDNPPSSLQDLLRQMAQQMAQAQSLLNSMPKEMRQEFEDLLESALDNSTLDELARLSSMMNQMFPVDELTQKYPFMGDEPLTLDEAMGVMGELQSIDQLDRQLQEVMKRGNIDNVDLEKTTELLGEDARRTLEALSRIEEQLEEAGYIKKNGDRLELTARGTRKIAQKALKDIFSELKKERLGQHDLTQRGANGDLTGDTKNYEFGDPFDLDLMTTLKNAVVRQGAGTPVKLTPDDFEVYRAEHKTQTSTVLLLDQSRSMGMFGSFLSAKKVAMALYALIHGQFPRDKLYLVGFSDKAQEIKEEELPQTSWNAWMSGTNMQHGLELSRKILGRHKLGKRQVIMVTDGEPTVHMEGEHAYFSYPPSNRTIEETLKEVKRCTKEGITINTFMLETSYYLLDFIDNLTRINKGKAFYTSPDNLGQYVLVDYLKNQRKQLRG